MDAPAYTVRNSLTDRERTYHLSDAALEWNGGGKGGGRLPFADVSQVRVFSYSNGGRETVQATIRAAGHRTVTIRSRSYVSLSIFEDRSATFAPFMRALLARIGAAAPSARFVAGSRGLQILWLVVAIIFVLLAALLAIIALDAGGANLGTSAVPAVIVLLMGAPVVWRNLAKRGPRSFDPTDPPPDLLREHDV